MTVDHLNDTPFEDIVRCFLSAFENYYVPMPSDPEYYRQRWAAARVDYALSFGMFDNGILVGFIIHAIDERQGQLTAYNTGTGVIPQYRGQKITSKIYQHAIPHLVKKGITRCTLEVVTKNDKAINAYHSAGFTVIKNYLCYEGTINITSTAHQYVREIALTDVDWSTLPNQNHYSWDFQKETIINSDYRFYEVYHNDVLESFFILNSEKRMVAQLDVFTLDPHAWNRLLSAIKGYASSIRVINIEERLQSKIQALIAAGFDNTINQFEMAMDI